MAIRILRLLEYVYEDAEIAERDMANWTHSINTKRERMKSAVLPLENIVWEETE